MNLAEAHAHISSHGQVESFLVMEISGEQTRRLVRVPGGGGAWSSTLDQIRKSRVLIWTEKKFAEVEKPTMEQAVAEALRKVGL